MPFGPGFPRPSIVLPRCFGCERKQCDVRRVADLLFGILAEETDESNSVEVHSFLLFCPSVSGTRKRVGAAPKTRSGFSGGTGTGEPEPERGRRQSRGFAGAGRRKSPEAVPRQRVAQETNQKQFRRVGRRRRQVAGQLRTRLNERSRRNSLERWEQASIPERVYAACRHL